MRDSACGSNATPRNLMLTNKNNETTKQKESTRVPLWVFFSHLSHTSHLNSFPLVHAGRSSLYVLARFIEKNRLNVISAFRCPRMVSSSALFALHHRSSMHVQLSSVFLNSSVSSCKSVVALMFSCTNFSLQALNSFICLLFSLSQSEFYASKNCQKASVDEKSSFQCLHYGRSHS